MSRRRVYGVLGNCAVSLGSTLAIVWATSWGHALPLLVLFVAANVLGHAEGIERR